MNKIYDIALSKLKGVGSSTALLLLEKYKDSKTIFSDNNLEINNKSIARLLTNGAKKQALLSAEKELRFIEKEQITPIFITDTQYPTRLKDCKGSPIIIYTKGTTELNSMRCLSIVGTRQPTQQGIHTTQKLIEEIADIFPHTLIISGLAYGVDITAHKAALHHRLPTVAVLGHGLHKTYPASHKSIAQRIVNESGMLITQYTSDATILPQNFVQRNSIIAGMADATIVVESKISGGAMSTARIAHSFGRDVLSVPGCISNEKSKGCNHLIKTHIAALIEDVKDIGYALSWDINKQKNTQQQLFFDLLPEEQQLVNLIQNKGKLNIDTLSNLAKIPTNKLLAILTQLEFKSIILAHPGKFYSINK